MDLEYDGVGPERRSDPRNRPQPEYRISLTLAVGDPQALWAAAAAKLLAAPDMTLEDVLDVIGPREDPAITDCIATLAKPDAMPGCLLDDFWIDSLRGAPPRIDMPREPNKAGADMTPRRPAPARRAGPGLKLCLLPIGRDDLQMI